MKLRYYTVLSIMLTLVSRVQALPLYGKSFFSPRSQSVNAARNLVGLTSFIYDPTACTNWSLWSFTVNYSQAFNTRRIAEYFFSTNTLRFTGSQVPDRDANDILADYFGLSTTFAGLVNLDPHWRSTLADIRFYAGLDGIAQGLYVSLYSPVVWTRSYIKLEELIDNNGATTPYPANYMSNTAINAPMRTITQAFARTTLYGDIQEPLKFGKIAEPQSRTDFADVHAVLGWNFLLKEHGHIGINAHVVIPTGNRSKAEFLFEPINGNGHHWEFGIGASGHVRIWEKDGEQEIALYVDATFTHICKSRQKRSFDFLKNGFGSRYILLKEFDSTGAYTRKSVPAINKTTLRCDVWNSIQIDFLIMFGYKHCNLNFDFGYNGWFRSREKIELLESLPRNKYGIKGIQNVTLLAGTQSNATESKATLHGTELANQALVMDMPSPIFVNTGDLNLKSAANSRALTHKLFAHLSYVWSTEWRADPFFGIGSEVEFEGIKPRDNEPNKPSMSQWSIWFKGGFVY